MRKELRFKKENGIWYIDLPNWIGPKHALSMVAGTDELLDLYNTYSIKKNDIVELRVNTGKGKPGLKGFGELLLKKVSSSTFGGATYNTGIKEVSTIWLCPVTLFVLHEYPEEIYVDFKREFMTPSFYYFTYDDKPYTGSTRDECLELEKRYDFNEWNRDLGKYGEALEASNMCEKGMSISEIAENMTISEEEVREIMIKYDWLFMKDSEDKPTIKDPE